MGKLVGCFGSLLFVAATVHVVLVYGEEWEFSPRGIPVTALSPDGETYRNGRPVDPLVRAMHESGFDEKYMAAALTVIFVVSVYIAIQLAGCSRLIGFINRSEARQAVYEFGQGLEQAGRLEDAAVANDFYWKKVAEEEARERRWRWRVKGLFKLLKVKRRA